MSNNLQIHIFTNGLRTSNLNYERDSHIQTLQHAFRSYLSALFHSGLTESSVTEESNKLLELIGKGEDEVKAFTVLSLQDGYDENEIQMNIQNALIAFNASLMSQNSSNATEDYTTEIKDYIEQMIHYLYHEEQQIGGKRQRRRGQTKKTKRTHRKKWKFQRNCNTRRKSKTMNMNWLKRRVNSLTLRNLQREESYLTEKE